MLSFRAHSIFTGAETHIIRFNSHDLIRFTDFFKSHSLMLFLDLLQEFTNLATLLSLSLSMCVAFLHSALIRKCREGTGYISSVCKE